METRKHLILLFVLLLFAQSMKAQTTFDSGEGCLNVIDGSFGQKLGEYGDKCFSVNYLHEKFINDQFSIGVGVGYSHHDKYDFSAVPLFLSTHYFFLDKRFSPFVNLRAGTFFKFGAERVDTNEKYSISGKKQNFNLYVSPSFGLKAHIMPNIGIMASISDEAYLLKAFDTPKNDYKTKLVHSLGINIGVCFQISGW